MRTPKEWHDQLLAEMNRPPSFYFCSASKDDIAQIQADALEYALQIAQAYESQTGRFIAQTLRNKIKELKGGDV